MEKDRGQGRPKLLKPLLMEIPKKQFEFVRNVPKVELERFYASGLNIEWLEAIDL